MLMYTKPCLENRRSMLMYTKPCLENRRSMLMYTKPCLENRRSMLMYTKPCLENRRSMLMHTKPCLENSEDLLQRLQSVQNAAARFITVARKYDHISPVLRDLHWLPLRQRIIFKIATLMHQCLNGLAPPYLATDCIAISSMPGRRQLRSATSGQLYIPRTKTMTFGPRSFKVSGPTIWNDLPARLKDSSLSKTLSENC